MSKLNVEDLEVVSFATSTADLSSSVPITVETQEVACWSPLCGPTFWKTCQETAAVAL
ncbi:MAG: hypothetical protein JWM27_4811 [Gemmatimonadetes bacterium]|nr:hypothetical protein [Gemmatimonadota bacterium]